MIVVETVGREHERNVTKAKTIKRPCDDRDAKKRTCPTRPTASSDDYGVSY